MAEPLPTSAPDIILPTADAPFTGKIGLIYKDSVPAFSDPVKAPQGAPNVLLVMTDDVGFGAASTFGGPIPTPNLDRLAAHGIKYNRFHTTAVCSATRAALLTGRNAHAVGAGSVPDLATGFPGYSNTLSKSAATIAEILRLNGYNTAMFGKHHNVQPGAGSVAGPFDQWPTGLGFEYFYGFIRAETDQFSPVLYRGTDRVDSPAGQVLDQMLVNDAIRWVHNQDAAAPNKPFFLYLAPGTAHGPHQAPKEWIDKFAGQFDQGWDKVRKQTIARQKMAQIVPSTSVLTARPPEIPAWASLTSDEKRVSARMMEVYAAMLSYQDAQFGRLVDELQRMGKLENTLVIFIEGDNGGSAEGGLKGSSDWIGTFANGGNESTSEVLAHLDELGGPNSYGIYPVGWAWATNAPFKWMKKIASHLGGTRNGLVIAWPKHIRRVGGVRSQFHHVSDIAPTILEAAGLRQPTVVNGVRQRPMDGISLNYSFNTSNAEDRRTTQYFEMQASRGIYHEGWFANTTPKKLPWTMSNPAGSPLDYKWELYDLRKDFSQAHDVAMRYPDILRVLQGLFDEEATRNKVFPLDDRESHDRAEEAKATGEKRTNYVYWGGDVSVTDDVAPPIRARSFSIVADIDVPLTGGSGVLVAQGGRFAGWSFYLKQGRPVAHQSFMRHAGQQFEIVGDTIVPPGAARVRYDFDYDGGGIGRGGKLCISVNDRPAGCGRMERTLTVTAGLGETFDIGQDTGDPVADYVGMNAFNGKIRKVEIIVKRR
ncbi:arylsulfatase [Caenibius tardaugens]|nr:arylsulfatase [Caenibius tardaugens]AZI35218.1 arylsulfatase [Caenibius tardaugens NBRC 16725]